MSDPVTVQDFPEIRWHGHWIWVPEEPIQPGSAFHGQIDPDMPEAHGLFRRRVHLDAVPARVPARITADSLRALCQWPRSCAWPRTQPAAAADVRPAGLGALFAGGRQHV
ncbi:MAG: hypothetical protein KDE23_25670, partial [Caldilinea sp.]|nr:hypothetical protein [Caldilinea sp.]